MFWLAGSLYLLCRGATSSTRFVRAAFLDYEEKAAKDQQ